MMLSDKYVFRVLVVAAVVMATMLEARAGFLFVLREQNGAPNQIYGFAVDESTGALNLLSGFPISSGGNGPPPDGSNHLITIDRRNQRLYVINDGSNTVTAFSIDPGSGQLTPLSFSPITLPTGNWAAISVHPSGSPLIVSDEDASPSIASFRITATTATAAAGSPYSTGGAEPNSSTLSRDGNFIYAAGGFMQTFAGFSVNSSTGVLTPVPGSPFSVGGPQAGGIVTDSRRRLFMTAPVDSTLMAFTTVHGVASAVSGSPFTSNAGSSPDSAIHPNENFLYVAAHTADRVGAFQISGNGLITTLTAVPGSPVNSGGTVTHIVTFNGSGAFLFALNNGTRNISTYGVDAATGALTFIGVQSANSLGTVGAVVGMDYLPTTFTVTNANDSGSGSLRQAVIDAASGHSGATIVFDREFFSIPRTISLTSGQISITSHINIVGPGANLLTIRNAAPAGATSRVFNIGGSFTVSLSGMTITGGNLNGASSGAGILNFNSGSKLLVTDCWIAGNTATANGGGIRSAGTLTLVNSTVSGNVANTTNIGGAGVDHSGFLNVTNSTISGNSKNGGSNGAGGIFMVGEALITNSTVTDNSTTGGAGGIVGGSAGPFTVRNTVIAGNRSNTSIPDVSGQFTLTGGGFNLIGNVGTALGFGQTGDQTGNGASPLDPRLVKVLAFKGGTTPVHVPRSSSPVVDKGSNSNITTDQRGFTRPFDHAGFPNAADGADIGAVERRVQESLFTAPFDFDGDGKTDLGIFRPLSNAQWWINQSSTGATFATQFGTGSTEIVPADYTGDGKTDIAVWRPANGTWFVLRSEDFSFFSFPFGQENDVPVAADFDGDTRADPAVFRPSTGTWFLLNSGGGTTILQFGANGDRPVPGDYDGDGRADIAIFRPSLGQWWLGRSSLGVIATTFGNSADKPVQGDYTGDGKVDIAFWRPSTGDWFVLRSEDFSFFSFPFGQNADLPAPGDYDGDGKHDATVFRPSNATWFSNRTTAGTLIQQFGISTDRPIPNAFVP